MYCLPPGGVNATNYKSTAFANSKSGGVNTKSTAFASLNVGKYAWWVVCELIRATEHNANRNNISLVYSQAKAEG